MNRRILDHIDLRVKNIENARAFYGKLLPALGFTCDRSDPEWGTFYAVGGDQVSAFFGFTADANHRPNETRIAFWADSREEVDRLAEFVRQIGGQNVDGPQLEPQYSPGYYACFFEDPDGNKLEICHRQQPVVAE
jgi:catechol 2,3-dioxygenase-like lactoylglutathione lyase family enzyme